MGKEPSQPNYFLVAGGGIVRFIPFPKVENKQPNPGSVLGHRVYLLQR